MKAAIIASIVAMLVSAASATAALVVTSKNIKNGTIQTVDISAKAKRALEGTAGARAEDKPERLVCEEPLGHRASGAAGGLAARLNSRGSRDVIVGEVANTEERSATSPFRRGATSSGPRRPS